MAFTGKAVVVILAGLSIYSYAVMVDRGLTLRWTRQRSAAFAREIEEGGLMLGEVKAVQECARRAEQDGHCTLAVVISAALAEYELLAEEGQSDVVVLEAVDDALGRSLDSVVANLRVRLSGMGTIVGVAPFLGLFWHRDWVDCRFSRHCHHRRRGPSRGIGRDLRSSSHHGHRPVCRYARPVGVQLFYQPH